MSYIVVLLISIIATIILKIIINTKIKDIKDIAENHKLDNISNKFSDNIEICKSILKIIKNDNVNIKENTENESSFYFIATNTINIANIKGTFTRIQTIAHECIHSIQDKKILWFNYIFSNLYVIYFILISILTIFKVINSYPIWLSILFIANTIWIFVREFLETDAMTRARYLAEKYIESENKEKNIVTKEEIKDLLDEYDKLNEKGIKLANYQLFLSGMLKIIIYLIIVTIIQFI